MSAAPPPLLEVRDLRLRRDGAFVLEVPRLDLAPGEVLALLGPNGAGKSSLLLALAGILRLGTGRLRLAGVAATDSASLAWRREVSLVFQEALLLRGSVRENVATGLRFRGVGRRDRVARVAEALGILRISHLAGRAAGSLSGGEAQRVSLARAIVCRPRLLLLDEPFAALDQPTREGLLADFGGILAASGATAIFATHDRVEALRLAGRAALLAEGRIVQIGTPGEVLNRPATAAAAAFLGVENMLPARHASDAGPVPAVRVGAALLACLELPAEGCGAGLLACIRPEHVALLPSGEEGRACPNCLEARVVSLTPLGPFWRVDLAGEAPLVAYVSPGLVHGLGLAPGVAVAAHLPPEAIHVIPAAPH